MKGGAQGGDGDPEVPIAPSIKFEQEVHGWHVHSSHSDTHVAAVAVVPHRR